MNNLNFPKSFKPISKKEEEEKPINEKQQSKFPASFKAKVKENKPGLQENIKEIIPQTVSGIGVGALGTYGDILDLLGIQSKETLPGEKSQYSMEFKASPEQLPHLVDSDDVLPRYSRLPSTGNVESLGKKTGMLKNAETPAGRFANRIGKIAGSSAALGGFNLKAPIAAGITGQTLEEAGAPPWAQAAGEMLAFIKTMPKSKINVSSKSPEVENLIKRLRDSGYTENDITLAKNALEERKILKPWSRLTKSAEKSIDSAIKNSESLFKTNISKGLPGYEKGGMSFLKNAANDLYKTMEDVATTIEIKNPKPLQDSIQNSIKYLEKHPLLPEQKQTVEFLNDALLKIPNAKTADFFTEFYRNLNRAGKWLNPKQKEHILRDTKDSIKKTFYESGNESARFGQQFEKVNESWKKWIDVQDAMEVLHKGQTTDGIDFRKIKNLLQDNDNMQLVEKALGKTQAQNLKSISEGADAIKTLDKSLQSTKDRNLLQGFKVFEGIKSLLSGDFKTLSTLIGLDMAQRLSTKLLIDPKYQNPLKNIIKASYSKSPKNAAILSRNLINKLDKEKD